MEEIILKYQLEDGTEGNFIPSDLDIVFLHYKLLELNILNNKKEVDFRVMLEEFFNNLDDNSNQEVFRLLIKSSVEEKKKYIEFVEDIIK